MPEPTILGAILASAALYMTKTTYELVHTAMARKNGGSTETRLLAAMEVCAGGLRELVAEEKRAHASMERALKDLGTAQAGVAAANDRDHREIAKSLHQCAIILAGLSAKGGGRDAT